MDKKSNEDAEEEPPLDNDILSDPPQKMQSKNMTNKDGEKDQQFKKISL